VTPVLTSNNPILDDQRRDGAINFILRIKEQGTLLTLHEPEDGDDNPIFFAYSLFLWFDRLSETL